jgi:tetratricopeptide (TPR) repeat protein
MDEILGALENNRYFDTVKKCDNLLRKKPLSWDEKYEVLVIKIKALLKAGLFEKALETIKTSENIKKIYDIYYYKALIDINHKKDFIKAEENLTKSLNLCPYRLEKERGLIYALDASLKASCLNYYAANEKLEKAKELLSEKDYFNCRLLFYTSSKNYKVVIKLLKKKKVFTEDEIIYYSNALFCCGYYKKAHAKLCAYFKLNKSENYQLLKLLYKTSLAVKDLESAKKAFDLLLKTDYCPDKAYLDFLFKNSAKYVQIKYFKSPRRNHLPDSIYSLVKNLKRGFETVESPLYKNWISSITGHLTLSGFEIIKFVPTLQNFKKLLYKNIPFILCKYDGGSVSYSLITGFNNQNATFISSDFAHKEIEPDLKSKEKKLLTSSFVITLPENKERIIKILTDKNVFKNSNLLCNAFSKYKNLEYKDALKILDEYASSDEKSIDHEYCLLKFNCLINENMYEEASVLAGNMKKAGYKNTSLIFTAELNFYKDEVSKAENIFEKLLKGKKTIHAIKGYFKLLVGKKDYEKMHELAKECYLLDTQNRDSIINLGVINIYLGNYQKAWNYINNALAIYNDSISLDYAGWAATRQDDFKKAKSYFEKSIEISPKNSYAYYQLGYVLRSTGNYYTAEDKLLKSIEISDKDPMVYIELATNYEGLKQYRKAVKSYLKALRLGIKEPYLLAHIGSCYGKLKVYPRALEYLKDACEKNPSYTWAFEELVYYLRQRAEALKNKNDFTGHKECFSVAVKYLKKAIKENPGETWLLNEIGYAYENLDNFERGAFYYKKALKIKESDYSYAHLGFCQRNLHKIHSAILNIKKSLRLNSSYFWAISELAYCYELKKDYLKAEKAYYKALSIKPDDPYSTGHLGYIYLEKALKMRRRANKRERNTNIDKAIYFLKKSVELDPGYVWALSELGYALRLTKNYRQASYYLEKAASLNQRDEWVLNELGYCYEQTREYKKAAGSFVKVIELDMNNSYAYAHLGHVNRNMNNINQAILYLIKSIRLNPKYFWAVTELGICLREKRWYKTAISIYKKAIQEVGKDSWVLNDMGYCYEQLGDYEEAERCFLKSSEININDEYPIAHLGNISMLKGQHAEAEYNLKKSIQINPSYTWAHNKLYEVYERKNNFSGSVEFIEKLFEKSPKSDYLMLKKAEYLREQKEYTKALAYLENIKKDTAFIEKAANKWLLKEPDNARNIIEAAILNDKGLYKDYKQLEKKALVFYKNEETLGFANLLVDIAINIEPEDYSLNITKALILAKLEKHESAIVYYKKAIKKVPNNHIAWERLAKTYYLTGDNQKALVSINKAFTLNKSSSAIHSLYAGILIATKDDEGKALSHLKHSLALDLNNEDANFLMAKLLFEKGFNEDALKYLEIYLRIVYKGTKFLDGIKLKNSIKKTIKNHNN